MRTIIVIPARYASSRLPGKPLLNKTGKYLIQHVYERASACQCAERVIVATDDARIEAAVRSFGGEVAFTRADHPSGTDRVAEVARTIAADVVVNLQGDEPLIDPATIDLLPEVLAKDVNAKMATLATPIQSEEQWMSRNCVKVVCDLNGRALYFSRSPIPFVRDQEPDFSVRPSMFLQHLGIYAYRRPFLLELATLPPCRLEQLEKLEQLRVLENGHAIQVGIVNHASIGVDTEEDYERFVETARRAMPHAA